jgi:hypothetical protein
MTQRLLFVNKLQKKTPKTAVESTGGGAPTKTGSGNLEFGGYYFAVMAMAEPIEILAVNVVTEELHGAVSE